MIRLIPLLLLLLCSVRPAAAQDDGEAGSRPDRGRLAWFITTAIPDELENPVRIMTGSGTSEVLLSRRMVSGPVKVPADGIIRMVRPVEQPTPDAPPFEVLAEARIPEGVQKAAVILIPAGEEQAPLVYRTKVQNLAEFGGGDYLFMNLTTANIMVRLGDKEVGLRPGKSDIYRAPALDNAVNTPISYHYYHPGREEWKLLSASTVVLRPTRREICVFSWDPRFKRVNYHGITFPVTR